MQDTDEGKVRVRVHQVARDLRSKLLSDSEVLHTFTLKNGLICAMDLEEDGKKDAGPSAAFQHRL